MTNLYGSRLGMMLELILATPICLMTYAPIANGGEARLLSYGTIVSASICDLVAHLRRFNNKTVRVRADFESDGFEHWSLVNFGCPAGGVKPAGGVFDPAVAPALLKALRQGCGGTGVTGGTADRRITATWQGVYHWESRRTLAVGMVQRWFDVQRIENLTVVPRQSSVSCPKRP